MTAQQIIKRPYVDLSMMAPNIKNLQELVRELEALSERAGMMAAYLEERNGYGCGDQGHERAIKNMNRVGKIIHTRAFGYNVFMDLSF